MYSLFVVTVPMPGTITLSANSGIMLISLLLVNDYLLLGCIVISKINTKNKNKKLLGRMIDMLVLQFSKLFVGGKHGLFLGGGGGGGAFPPIPLPFPSPCLLLLMSLDLSS